MSPALRPTRLPTLITTRELLDTIRIGIYASLVVGGIYFVAALACVVPLLIAAGLTATFLRPMALAFALGIAASMVVAVTVTPALGALLLREQQVPPDPAEAERLLATAIKPVVLWGEQNETKVKNCQKKYASALNSL